MESWRVTGIMYPSVFFGVSLCLCPYKIDLIRNWLFLKIRLPICRFLSFEIIVRQFIESGIEFFGLAIVGLNFGIDIDGLPFSIY